MIDPVRRAQIIRLLETRDDHLPFPSRPGVQPPAGFVHHTVVRESCPDCLANDRAIPGCETCQGRGYVESMRDRDPYAASDKVQPYGLSGDRHERRRARDNEITMLDRQLAPPWETPADELDDANAHPDAWEVERDRKWRDYDYGILDLALDALRLNDQGAYELLHAVYVYAWLDGTAHVRVAVERGLAFLDARMPDTIRAPGDEPAPAAKESLWRGRSEQHARARERRRERVLRAHLEWGWSTTQVASHESLSDRRVRQILEEHRGLFGDACASGPAA